MRLMKSGCNFRLAFFVFAVGYLSILVGFLILNSFKHAYPMG